MLKLHLLSVEKSLKMVKNKRDLKSPHRNRSFGGCRPSARSKRDSTSAKNCGNIRVAIRVRPTNEREVGDNFRNVVKVLNDQTMVFDPKEDDEPFFYHGVQQRNRDLLKRAHKDLHFTFDHVFDTNSTNSSIFDGSTKDLINWLMDGYNCSVFVYGATGAGKTHTMLGSGNDPGITFRTMTELFNRKEMLASERDFELGMTYLEVYNETVQDLLNPGTPLHLREDGKFGVIVAGNRLQRIEESSKLFDLLEQGNKNRTQHPTDANAESSRSHAIFQVYLRMKFKVTGEVRVAKLSMIDLAGSERGSATGYNGARFNEGANINKSLLALGNCITSLADGQKHVPYRDSKLTRLLKDSLGGNCQTIMIANVSPSSMSFEDTYNTLKYAMRATKIKSNIKKNIVNCETNVHHYIQLVEKLTEENKNLKLKLASRESLSPLSDIQIETPSLEEQKELHMLYLERRQLEEQLNNVECSAHLMVLRKTIKEEYDARLSGICTNTPDKISGHRRLENAVNSLDRQIANLNNEIQMLSQQCKQLDERISKYVEKIPSLKSFARLQEAEFACFKADKKANLHLRASEMQLKELKIRDNLLDQVCKVLQPCFKQLRGLGYATDELITNYNGLVKHLQGIRSVKWEDESGDSGIGSSTTVICYDEKPSAHNRHEELNVMDHTFTLPNHKASTVEQHISKGDSPTARVASTENATDIRANQLMFKVFADEGHKMEVGHWTDGFGVKHLMTKLYDSPLDEEAALLQEVPLNQTRIISQIKKPASVGAKKLINKVYTPTHKSKINNNSPRTPKENKIPFRARPVPLSNSVRPKSLIDKPKGILKRTRCETATRSTSNIRK